MFVAAERLLLKLRQPASRADELIELRRRVREELAADVSGDERALAAEVAARKLAAAALLTDVRSCSSCARGAPLPRGHYAGGDCCAGSTPDMFDDNELAALVLAGTRAGDLVAPARAEVHAGCAFRGPRGCTLEVAHRPGRCVHYLCETLRGELHAGSRLDAIEAALAALSDAMRRFTQVHQARRDREVAGPILDAIEAAAPVRARAP